ncbi:MAG: FAD-binding oxidoreductase [Deltaproteobacteria bacterium]|nr:FAD-binding oxidoreductase [Deltaproteobacteria bacterium]
MPNEAIIENFKAGLRGELLRPGDEGYEAARKVYNGMIDRRPSLIARCANVADVIASVRFAGETGMLTSIRGGGHNAGGLGICDDGLVIDLSPMRGVRVDPRARTARVEGGCKWGDVDHATHAFGLATPAGIISTTGVGGLTLGGGLGHLTWKCGLTIDNLLAADVVLADGRFVTASADEDEDLFWAIRGGGGNFGVVWCYTGKPERLDETLKPMRGFATPAFEFIGPMPYPALQSFFDPLYPPGPQWYWKADFVKKLSDEAIGLHVKHGSAVPTPHSAMHLYPVNGAAHRAGSNATAWSYRDATWAEVIVGVDPDPGTRDRITGWAKAYWEALHPHSEGGAYVNFMMHDEGQDRVEATYRDNYQRLIAVKSKYDPANFFRVNQNIRPAA